jgi:hypothetical protein
MPWRATWVEHVVEERHPGRKVGTTAAVEVDLDGDRGLGGLAIDRGPCVPAARRERSWLLYTPAH